jgi:cytochrome c oxidase subunit 4
VTPMAAQYEKAHPPVPYGLYFKVWVALILLTVLTVSVSYANMQQSRILTALMIAAVKILLVVLYFMHIRFERLLYTYMIIVVIVTYGIFVSLTFSDYLFR